ncbi:MAG: ATP-binding cassette domain-containing protein [Acidimicrobiia bacterium]
MSAPAAPLAVRGLEAGYEGVAVVHDVDLHVQAGEVVALLGANGAGKTTTLLTLSGLIPRLGGEVDVLGVSQARSSRRTAARHALMLVRRGVRHVPEDRALFFGLTGREHLRLAAPPRDRGAIERALAPFPVLEAIIDRRAGLMSGGEQQMLAIARALVGQPQLLMIDEMSLGLAPIVVEQLLPTVAGIAREHGIGVLLVEQHVHAVLAVADRAYVMAQGRISAEGSAANLAADPARLAGWYLGASSAAE